MRAAAKSKHLAGQEERVEVLLERRQRVRSQVQQLAHRLQVPPRTRRNELCLRVDVLLRRVNQDARAAASDARAAEGFFPRPGTHW
jgi:hypothetical protein